MIDLTTFFSDLGIVVGNTNATNQYEFYYGIQWDDGDITYNQFEFYKKISISRYEFFKQYTNETEFYKNTNDARIWDYKTFYKYAGQYLVVVSNWILANGLWDDSKEWIDEDLWIDGESISIYTVGLLTGGVTTRKYDYDGTLINSVDTTVTDTITVDSDGNVIVGGLRSAFTGIATKKYDSSFNLLLELTNEANSSVNGVATDGDNNIYTVDSPNGQLKKYNSLGTLLWTELHGSGLQCVATDSVGNVYIGGALIGGFTTRKYDTNGTLLWSRSHGAIVRGIATDSLGNVYTVGNVSSNITTRKYDTNGSLLWSRNHGGTTYGVATDSDNNVYTVGELISDVTTRKYDTNGTLLWTANHGDRTLGVAVDSFNNMYTAGRLVSGVTTRKYNSLGIEKWTANHGGNVSDIAVSPIL